MISYFVIRLCREVLCNGPRHYVQLCIARFVTAYGCVVSVNCGVRGVLIPHCVLGVLVCLLAHVVQYLLYLAQTNRVSHYTQCLYLSRSYSGFS